MGDLYSDDDPYYRKTKLNSGIPPPSTRDQRQYRRPDAPDLSCWNPSFRRAQVDDRREYPRQLRQQQEHRSTSSDAPPRPHAVPKPAPKLDLRVSTDFLSCGQEPGSQKLSLDKITEAIQVSDAEIDYEFLSSGALVEKATALRAKISEVPAHLVSLARARSNPFERIGKSIFMNRAATKLAALDVTFGLLQDATLTFVDICGGPGGFSEYLLWRAHSWGGEAQGFGITLKAPSDLDYLNWHVEQFRSDAMPSKLKILNGVDGTGDLYKEENIRDFAKQVLQQTEQKGVDLAVADGGFDFSGKEEHQERHAKRLLLCEIITMLLCLKQGGTFVCKFFDIVEEFTADMVWLLYQLFDSICITKPLSSRPANSERYLVCKGLRFLKPSTLIERLLGISKEAETAGRLVPRSLLESDENFLDYVKTRNIKFVLKQIDALELLQQYIEEPLVSYSSIHGKQK
ncbi:FtsJ methyltransferase domain-containing protein 2 [Apophysomyces ossiformis]|uniref:Cap-specific mRNA (nucleoside-2'-O-)-methyltransferase 1 n=1 Tax=Apophysomyces ossiformis TaxID=679940 RepID=A0A8H7BFD5_9FUNG|nr:FtsJ methyltransferase domain-containing protein 2 [Apophysomyces ossiformis]